MTTTITIEAETLERFNHLKGELEESQEGAPHHNHDSFLNALLDTWEAAEEGYYDGGVGDLRPFGGKVPDVIEGDVEVEPIVDYDELAKTVGRNIDYAQLANQVAEELEGRMK